MLLAGPGDEGVGARTRRPGPLTNRAIAQNLFVTPETAETHLAAAHRKLDITGRSELPGALP